MRVFVAVGALSPELGLLLQVVIGGMLVEQRNYSTTQIAGGQGLFQPLPVMRGARQNSL